MTDAQFKQLMELGHRLVDKKQGKPERLRSPRKCGLGYCIVVVMNDEHSIRHKGTLFCSESHKDYYQSAENL